MQNKPIRSVAEVLRSGRLRHYGHRGEQLRKLTYIVNQHLDQALQPHYQLAKYSEGTLVLIASDGAWGTRLRYAGQQLRKHLTTHPEFSQLNKIMVRIRPAVTKTPRETIVRSISSASRQHLRDIAAQIKDPELKKSLEQLAS